MDREWKLTRRLSLETLIEREVKELEIKMYISKRD